MTNEIFKFYREKSRTARAHASFQYKPKRIQIHVFMVKYNNYHNNIVIMGRAFILLI